MSGLKRQSAFGSPRVALVAAAANHGGAHVAALRLYRGLRAAGCDATYVTGLVAPGQRDVGPPSTRVEEARWKARARIGRAIARGFDRQAMGMQSLNILPSGLDWRLSSRRFQLVHLHWVNNELLSIPEIGRIDAPMVWTLHDMWAFCGTEHYMSDPSAYLGVVGTRPSAGPSQLARWNWERKRRWWAGVRPILVAPSNWLADLVRQSRLLGQCRVEVVPYGLDLNRFSPAAAASHSGKRSLRVVFGAAGGSQDHRKGFDLLIPAVRRLAAMLPESCLELLVFGEAATPSFDPLPSSVSLSSAGVIDSEEAMSKLLASADIFVAPSRQDNLPNTVLEATACGVPTVAFRVGGMPDMIEHQVSGYLARPYEAEDLAAGMAWALHDSTRLDRLKQAARTKAEREFGSDRQADRMLAIYDEAIRASR